MGIHEGEGIWKTFRGRGLVMEKDWWSRVWKGLRGLCGGGGDAPGSTV